MLTHAGLFSGIGGFSLAAQRVGWRNLFEVEKEEWCRGVLHKNFPDSLLYDDVCTFSGLPFRGRVDVLSGGDPCQPNSQAGRRAGAADPRFLWPEKLRILAELAPSWVVNENVPGSISNGVLDRKISDLEAQGYACWPAFDVFAAAVGSPQERRRIWLVAYSQRVADRSKRLGAAAGPPRSLQSQVEEWERLWLHPAPVPAHRWPPRPYDIDQLPREPNGVPAGLVRPALKAYGNAIVPQVAELFFRAIAAVESSLP
jgi:DNA (cytosine-5)-methyltransferase 1